MKFRWISHIKMSIKSFIMFHDCIKTSTTTRSIKARQQITGNHRRFDLCDPINRKCSLSTSKCLPQSVARKLINFLIDKLASLSHTNADQIDTRELFFVDLDEQIDKSNTNNPITQFISLSTLLFFDLLSS